MSAKVKAGSGVADHEASLVASALKTLDAAGSGIAALSAALRDSLGHALVAAADAIRTSQNDPKNGRLIVTGMGKSGHVARKLAATFASTGTPAFFVHPSEASHGDLGMITRDDVILALSWSGETAELKNLIDHSKRHSVRLIGITSEVGSTLGRAADVALVLPQVREACPHNLAPTTSSLMQLALGDALAIALLQSRGFSARDFHVLHPAGRLGALLKSARDVMRTGDAVPLANSGALMSDAVIEMSAKGVGCVGILDAHGQLTGIITDGDLRRNMRPGLTELAVDDIMTRNPKSCRPDQLVSEVIEALNASKITAMFVVECHRPVGVLHLHDLLRIGAA
ncbi:KpsF/GutQ family sugar-phosphate isomerase [Pseudorhodoplanes sp.]|uniref:KpsF/GutQ family sugar-phosphate isomerase n=1 Tax=Pseudorhodoplanes sp. TaxID=1934341 RepID=UPI002D11E329|nr:KpsF/GutQ family sugar-phosphate isomerase [Pseudorhodoplanes sp.]HWV42662.1 KpsF/GutQ family sugar-phosphate isomerase [Pseudorhodoplanes sp.]